LAIALVGPSGSGKSSTAAAFARLGYPVLTDDKVAIMQMNDCFQVEPAYPSVRLWSDSVSSLFGSEDALPRIAPNWDKRFLDLNSPGFQFQSDPLPLAAIYFLGERSSSPGVPHVEAISPRTGLMTVVSDLHVSNLLNRHQRTLEFALLGRLSESVPLRRVTPSSDFARISDLCNAIVADFKRLVPFPSIEAVAVS
jgi:ABC-type dipeptide/oligopeptide/nickel transport system ATPase component